MQQSDSLPTTKCTTREQLLVPQSALASSRPSSPNEWTRTTLHTSDELPHNPDTERCQSSPKPKAVLRQGKGVCESVIDSNADNDSGVV